MCRRRICSSPSNKEKTMGDSLEQFEEEMDSQIDHDRDDDEDTDGDDDKDSEDEDR